MFHSKLNLVASMQAADSAVAWICWNCIVRWHHHQKSCRVLNFGRHSRQTGGSHATKETMDCWEETGSKSNPAPTVIFWGGFGHVSPEECGLAKNPKHDSKRYIGNPSQDLSLVLAPWILMSFLRDSSCDPQNSWTYIVHITNYFQGHKSLKSDINVLNPISNLDIVTKIWFFSRLLATTG